MTAAAACLGWVVIGGGLRLALQLLLCGAGPLLMRPLAVSTWWWRRERGFPLRREQGFPLGREQGFPLGRERGVPSL